jgi:hypothetical protein
LGTRRFSVPILGSLFEIERRKLALNGILQSEVQLHRLIRLRMAQNGSGFPRVMITVVKEENNLTSNFTSQASGGLNFRK